MNESHSTVSEDELHACVDQQIDPGRRSAIELYLREHPDVAQRIAAYWRQRVLLREALSPLAAGPVPPRLRLDRMIGERHRRRQPLWPRAAITSSTAFDKAHITPYKEAWAFKFKTTGVHACCTQPEKPSPGTTTIKLSARSQERASARAFDATARRRRVVRAPDGSDRSRDRARAQTSTPPWCLRTLLLIKALRRGA